MCLYLPVLLMWPVLQATNQPLRVKTKKYTNYHNMLLRSSSGRHIVVTASVWLKQNPHQMNMSHCSHTLQNYTVVQKTLSWDVTSFHLQEWEHFLMYLISVLLSLPQVRRGFRRFYTWSVTVQTPPRQRGGTWTNVSLTLNQLYR